MSFIILTATVSEIFAGQTNSSILDERYCSLLFDGVKYVVGPNYVIHGSIVSYHSESFVISQWTTGNLIRIGTHQAVFRFS